MIRNVGKAVTTSKNLYLIVFKTPVYKYHSTKLFDNYVAPVTTMC